MNQLSMRCGHASLIPRCLFLQDWNPLYLVSGATPGFAAGVEVLSAWDPTKYGKIAGHLCPTWKVCWRYQA